MPFLPSHTEPLLSPKELRQCLPLPDECSDSILESRKTIVDILSGKDPRLLLIVGPCSIHDITAALSYARHLKTLSDEVSSSFFIVMRAYFEKPRTRLGWKGLLHDSNLTGSPNLVNGLHSSRKLLIELAKLGLPTACEFLEPLVAPYLQDLISWGAIGARTTTSQIHRQLASGLPLPVGFKNPRDGNTSCAVDAILTAREIHSYLSLNAEGKSSVIRTAGNPWTHIVLRGGTEKPNYHPHDIEQVTKKLEEAALPNRMVIDCSHDNSRKRHDQQPLVFAEVLDQILDGRKEIAGLMLESHLQAGSQPEENLTNVHPELSLTDPCLDWESTKELILEAHGKLSTRIVQPAEFASEVQP